MKNVRLLHLSAMRKIKRHIRKYKALCNKRSKRKKVKGRSFGRGNSYWVTQKNINIIPNFSLLQNTENVIKQVRNIIKVRLDDNFKGKIFLNLSHVTNLDIGALGLLLSGIHALRDSNFVVGGNLPKNDFCRDLFINSGILDYARMVQGKKPNKRNENNVLLEKGFDRTSNNKVGECVRKVYSELMHKEGTFRPVFSIIQEMCANSIEHANKIKDRKNWLLVIYNEKEKVIFNMVDIGDGILGTLRRKTNQQIKDLLLNDDIDILKGVFRRKYQSSTFDENRNNGLPKIEETFIKGYIENLKVITNNVMIDFKNESKSRKLNISFKGTYYYFELTKNSIKTWENRFV